MDKRIILEAPDGFAFTNDEISGYVIQLAIGASDEDFYLITEEEYQEILKKQTEIIE